MESKPNQVANDGAQNAAHQQPARIEEECSICLNIMVEPCSLNPSCKHTFCIQCVVAFLEQKSECPLDRIPLVPNFTPKVNEKLQYIIKNQNPDQYAKHLEELRKSNSLY